MALQPIFALINQFNEYRDNPNPRAAQALLDVYDRVKNQIGGELDEVRHKDIIAGLERARRAVERAKLLPLTVEFE